MYSHLGVRTHMLILCLTQSAGTDYSSCLSHRHTTLFLGFISRPYL